MDWGGGEITKVWVANSYSLRKGSVLPTILGITNTLVNTRDGQ